MRRANVSTVAGQFIWCAVDKAEGFRWWQTQRYSSINWLKAAGQPANVNDGVDPFRILEGRPFDPIAGA